MIQRYNKILHHFLLWNQQITCNDTLDALCGRSFMSNILTGGSYYGYQIRCSIILVYIAFHCLSNSITFNPLNYNSQIRTRCTIWYMSLWNTLSFDYSFVTISWRNKNISLIKIQSLTKNHIRDLFQFISSTSTFVTQKLGSRNDLIPIHKFVSKGNFSSDTFSSWNRIVLFIYHR